MEIALYIAAAVLALVVFSGVYTFLAACFYGKSISWLNSNALKGTIYEKFSSLIQDSHNWLVSHNAQDVYTVSKDGLKLHALWVPAKEPKATIILAHGYKSTYLVDFGKALQIYHDFGLNLLLPTQRAHGESQGKIITFGVKESEDMLCWLNYHNRTFGMYQTILSGMSMGASTMMYLADKDLPDNVKGLIVDCGFSSPAEIISVVFKRTTHLPAVPVIWVADIVARIFCGFSLYQRDSKKTLSKNKLPIIMIHGKADNFVPHQMTIDGYNACTGDKQLLLVENAGHGLSFLHAENEYKALITKFLTDNIEGF